MLKKHYSPNCEIKSGMSVPDGLQRWALVVEYHGAHYQGFQRQASAKQTVQGSLEQALSKIANQSVTLVCAGRTDAGVHATQQVVHFDTTANRNGRAWLAGTNTHLPDDIRVVHAQQMPLEFHARFSAKARTYRYLTCTASVRSAILPRSVTWIKHPLDTSLMEEGAQLFLGEHNFSSFRSSQCQAHSPVRTILDIQVKQVGELYVTQIKANAFLHHMVRNIMGVLHLIGAGRKPAGWVTQLIEAQDRTLAAPTAAADGLYFVSVDYDTQFNLQLEPRGPLFLPADI